MQFSTIAQVLWAAGFAELSILLLVLLIRGRGRTFPLFTSWILFQLLRTALLFSLYRMGTSKTYAMAYWSGSVLDTLLQVAIVFELARSVLKPTGAWIHEARRSFLAFSLGGTLIAIAASYAVYPVHSNTFGDWLERGYLFAAMLNLQLFTAMSLASKRLGLAWRHHVMGIATGWTLWAVVGLFVEAAYSYLGANWHGVILDQIRIVAYQTATIYWAINLWLPEPESRTLSPEMLAYLSELQKRAQLQSEVVSNLKKH